MAKKEVTLTKDGYKTVWRNGTGGSVDVDVYKNDKLVLEWTYPKMFGRSVADNAAGWLDQAVLQTKK